MAVERLLTNTANLQSINQVGAIGGTSHQLGWNFKTNAAGKKVVAMYVKMNNAGVFAAGTRVQLWKRASPISASTLIQNIDIGGLAGAAGLEIAVPGVAQTALVQNDFYFATIFHPDTETSNYWFKGGFGNPVNGSLSGNCIFKDGGVATVPPDDETFVLGGFAVDIAIDDAAADITATLAITLPVPTVAAAVTTAATATLDIVLPVPVLGMTATAPGVVVDDTLFSPIAQRLLDCWTAQLEALPAAQRPARIGFRFDATLPSMGIALNEDECKCGSAWVRFVDWFITSDETFPSSDTSLQAQICPAAYGLVLELGIGRCPPIGTEQVLPTIAELNAFHAQVLADVQAMRKTINCCFNAIPLTVPDDMVIGSWQKTGPDGACFQHALSITIKVINCNEC
jgi:hypothetical protein